MSHDSFLSRLHPQIAQPPQVAAPEPLSRESLLADLTPPQSQAVLCTEGPLLVLAAAGSGKTRVITRRIAYLVSCGVPAWSILALTFTNKAAGEMRERVYHLIGSAEQRPVRGLTITTFHSLCARLLRRYAVPAGLKPDFTIYDTSDQTALCKKVIEGLQLSTSNFPARSVLSAISNAKNDLLDAEAFAQQVFDFSGKQIAKIYASYTKALRSANAVDFDDLLLLMAKVLKIDESVREECRRRWQYLLVDEYQDTNHAQFLIASLIAGEGDKAAKGDGAKAAGPNFCVVGDPDQAIYGWRGADISNILEFEEHYPGAKVITLGENFRSTAPILAVADGLIRHNKRRKHKDLFTSRKGGEKVEAVLCRDERHEAQLVADWLKAQSQASAEDEHEGIPWREMAVFYRTNSLSRVMEESLRGASIPYTIARGTAFYEREEVKTALAYLRVVANQADGVSLARIVNTPTRGIGGTSLDRVEVFAAPQGLTLFEAMQRAGEVPGLTPRATSAMNKFVEMVNGWTGGGTFLGAQVSHTLPELVDRIVKESGLEAMYKAQAQTSKTQTDEERLDNLAELVSSARQFELEYDISADPGSDAPFVPEAAATTAPATPPLLALLRAYLESVALVADADAVDPAQGSVTLMTLHAAKGLEFKAVAMIGLEEGLLPHSRAIGAPTDADMEEERRLCFVGITRAMRRLHMTAAKYRTIRGMSERTIPSRFLGEVPAGHMVVCDQSDTFGDVAGAQWGESGGEAESYTPAGKTALGSPRRHSTPLPGLAGEFPVGSQVRHPQFGVGTVKSVESGTNARAVIAFRDAGTKTLVLEYARLTRV